MADPVHILIIRLGGLGDVLNTLAAARALRRGFPSPARVAWLVEDSAAPLVSAAPDVDETITLPRRRWSRLLRRPWCWPIFAWELGGFIRSLRRRRFDLLLDAQGNLKSGLLARLSGTPRRVGFAAGFDREWNHLFMTEQVALLSPRVPRTEKHLALVQHVLPAAAWERPEIWVSPEDEQAVASFVADSGLAGATFAVIHPGASAFGAFKRWPAERHGAVAAQLYEKDGVRSVVSWGSGEQPLAAAVVAASRGAALLAPALTLLQLAALLRRAALVVASDTGPLHLAAALGRPVVAIFGPKDPVIYGPYDCPARIVRKDLDCAPCARRRCPHPRCLEAIQAEEVVAAAESLLEETNRIQDLGFKIRDYGRNLSS